MCVVIVVVCGGGGGVNMDPCIRWMHGWLHIQVWVGPAQVGCRPSLFNYICNAAKSIFESPVPRNSAFSPKT